MADVRVDRLARVVVERMLAVRAGQVVAVDGPSLAAPLIERLAARVHEAGGLLSARVGVDCLARALLHEADPAVVGRADATLERIVGRTDAMVRIGGEWNVADLADVPAATSQAALRAAGPANALRFRRAAAGGLRWAVTIYPTEAHAQLAGLRLGAFADLVFRAAKVDRDDPVAAWREQGERQERLRALLERGRDLHLLGDGTDLRLSVAGRRWRSSAANRNLPDGEVFSGPVEDSAEGTVRFTYPIVRAGKRIEDVRLRFARGEVVEAHAARGEEDLHELLAVDPGARRLGEVGIGTNDDLDRFTGQILLDEKIGGTFHLALGRGYPETGSTNVSSEHWDLICDLRGGGEIRLDDVPLQRDGRFVADLGLDR